MKRRTKYTSSRAHEPVLADCQSILLAAVFTGNNIVEPHLWPDLLLKGDISSLISITWKQATKLNKKEVGNSDAEVRIEPTPEEARKVSIHLYI